MKTISVATLCGALLATAACGSESPSGSEEAGEGSGGGRVVSEQNGPAENGPEHGGQGLESPGPFTIQQGEDVLTLAPVTFCWKTGCAEGVPPTDLPRLGTVTEAITVHLDEAMAGWRVRASQTTSDSFEACAQYDPLKAEKIDDKTWTVTPIGDPGEYAISISATGDGDASAYFKIDSELSSPWPPSEATFTAGRLETDDEQWTDYLYVRIVGLRAMPKRASLDVSVTPDDGGEPTAITMPPPVREGEGCDDSMMTIAFEADNGAENPPENFHLPKNPARFDLELELNGDIYTASVDVSEPPTGGQSEFEEQRADLEFSPALPSR